MKIAGFYEDDSDLTHTKSVTLTVYKWNQMDPCTLSELRGDCEILKSEKHCASQQEPQYGFLTSRSKWASPFTPDGVHVAM